MLTYPSEHQSVTLSARACCVLDGLAGDEASRGLHESNKSTSWFAHRSPLPTSVVRAPPPGRVKSLLLTAHYFQPTSVDLAEAQERLGRWEWGGAVEVRGAGMGVGVGVRGRKYAKFDV